MVSLESRGPQKANQIEGCIIATFDWGKGMQKWPSFFVGLTASTLNCDHAVAENALHQIMPQLVNWFNEWGLWSDTTAEMREQLFALGMGDFPILPPTNTTCSNIASQTIPNNLGACARKPSHPVFKSHRSVVTSYARLERKRSAAG